MKPIIDLLDRKLYPGVDGHWDDIIFRDRLLREIGPKSEVLDVGAGAGIVKEMNFKGIAARVVGIDFDERVLTNPYLDEAHVGDGGALPFADSSFDVVFADNVLEHLASPDVVFAEINRVLRPGGVFFGKTPNAWHYMPLIARSTPHSFHRWINRKRGRAEVDTFPTLYRANSRSAIRKLAQKAGFEVSNVEFFELRPEYLRIHPLTYLGGYAYERVVNSLPFLQQLRIVLIATLRKPSLSA